MNKSGAAEGKITGLLIRGPVVSFENFCKDFWEMGLEKRYNLRSLSSHLGFLMLF